MARLTPSWPLNTGSSGQSGGVIHSTSGSQYARNPSTPSRLSAAMALDEVSTFCSEISPHLPARITGQVSPISSVEGDAHGVMSSPVVYRGTTVIDSEPGRRHVPDTVGSKQLHGRVDVPGVSGLNRLTPEREVGGRGLISHHPASIPLEH